jgi:Carboxypeptidase regulatory-like domain/TonB-dependent Receptor Plug Domain/TonB dependent receptor
MRASYRFAFVLSVCLLLVAPLAVFGQTTGTIEGQVTDQNGGALPGVTLELSGPNLQGSRTATTDGQGRYRFVSLTPGRYTVTANLSGFGQVQKTATVQLDATANVGLQMSLAAKESVIVSGEAPLVDVTSTTTGSSYTAKVIDKLPVGRNYASIVQSQPGVQTDYGETQGRSLALSVYGATSAENLFIVDGVNTTNVIKGFQGKSLNPEFIQEVEVKTGGYQAEYGRNTGGVINVITKSGGNEFHGDVFGYYNNKSMRSDIKHVSTPQFSQTGDVGYGTIIDADTRKDYGADVGGYFVKDRIWFFGAYDRLDQNTTYFPIDGARANERFPLDFKADTYSGKLTFNVMQGTSIVGTLFADPQTNSGAINTPHGFNPLSYTGDRKLGGTDWAARANQLFGSFGIFTAQFGQHKDQFSTIPGGLDVIQFSDRTVNPSVATGGFGSVFGPTINNKSKRDQAGGALTLYMGPNELKLGGDYQKDNTTGSTFYTGGQLVRILPCSASRVCAPGLAPTITNAAGVTLPVYYEHFVFTPSGTDLTPLATAPFNVSTKRNGAYLQDQLRIGKALTINAGIRWDSENVLKGNGETAFKLNNQWAPRFGFVWDFVGDGTSKLYGSAGRFFYSLPTDLNARVFTANTQLVTFNYSPTDIAQSSAPPTGRTRLIQVGSFDGEPVEKGLKAAYQDELTLGIEKALTPTFSVGMKGTYRNLGRTVEDRCDLDYTDPAALGSTCGIFNPGGSGPIANGAIATCDTSSNPADPNAGLCGLAGVPVGPARRIFRGIEMTARKSFTTNFWAQASYLYSSLRGNYSGAIREASGQTDPGINADYDYNQFLINAYGKLELDRPHQFRIDAVYTAPFGLSVGFQGYIRSGQPKNNLGYYNSFYPDLLYLSQRGYAGREPTEYEANLSLGYNLVIGPVTITPQLYVFNILNRQVETANDDGVNTVFGTYTPAGVAVIDNPDYRKTFARSGARLFRGALKITF